MEELIQKIEKEVELIKQRNLRVETACNMIKNVRENQYCKKLSSCMIISDESGITKEYTDCVKEVKSSLLSN